MNHMFSGSISPVWVLIASCMPVCNVMRTPCYCRILRVGKSCAACSEAELGYLIAAPSRAGDGHGIQWRGQRLGGCCSSILSAHANSEHKYTCHNIVVLLVFLGFPQKNVSSLLDVLKQSAVPSQGNQRQNADSSGMESTNRQSFTDIIEIFGEGLLALKIHGSTCVWRQVRPFAECCARQTHRYCLEHDMICPFQTGASGRVGGTPCQDFSSSGLRRKT